MQDLEMVVTELAAISDKQTIMQIYTEATREPYSFLFANLRKQDKNDIFSIRFDQKILIDED